MFALILTGLIFNAHAEPQEQIDPIEPAFAADQPTVGFDSMFREMSQFSNFSNWNALRGELASKRGECELKMKALARAKRLRKGLVSEMEMERKEYDVEMCKAAIELTEKAVENSKASAAYDKFMIVQAGNPGTDLRRELAEQLKRQVQFEGETLKINERMAEITRVFKKSNFDRSVDLCDKKIMMPPECDQIRAEYEGALSRQRTLNAQSKINARSLEGLLRSIARLNAGSAGAVQK